MNVSNNGPVGPNAVNNRSHVRSIGQQYRPNETTARRGESDGVELSEQARLLRKMSEESEQTDEAREKKVAELRAQVEEGRYPISPVEIAKAILASRRGHDNPV